MGRKIGICGCGCGRKTEIANRTDHRQGIVRGEPKPFLPHHAKYRGVSRDGRTKVCRTCLVRKRLRDFHLGLSSPDGRQTNCKKCCSTLHKKYREGKGAGRMALARMKHKLVPYGLTLAEYQSIYDSQGGVCAICKKPECVKFRGKVRNLAIDHEHETGKVRGLLCMNCNRGLGAFFDDITVMHAAITYLGGHDSG